MARPLRPQVAGGLYHVTSRGNNRGQITFQEGDYRYFVALLERTVVKKGWICHGYCVMPNHYHLFIETPQPNLAAGMQLLNSAFAQSINQVHSRSGHLFQGRYGAVLIEREEHLLEVMRYVVLNPVRAGLCADPADWPWSSYRATAGLEPCPRFLSKRLLKSFASDMREAERRFRAFVADTPDRPPTLLVA